ncbi:MAG TPA: 6-phospho-beta-glucosidase [Eubacteriales bacterium]|nr:6-phospho-beta-glucosidase [Eubacteriales bacterium]
MGIRLAVVGAGSTYCPELMQGLIKRRELLPLDELRLTDIDESRLNLVGDFCERVLYENGMEPRIFRSTDLERTLEGADYIVTQIRAGRLEARIRDEKIPLEFGMIGQETTGIGGFTNALRTIPQIERIARAIEKCAPEAWLVNFTNPSGIITEYLLNHTSVKAIGLCNLPIGTQERVAKLLGVPMDRVRLESISLNHCGAITGVYADGLDRLPSLLTPESLDEAAAADPWVKNYRPIIELLGAIPNDYLQYFFYRDRKFQELLHAAQTRGEVCKDIETRLLSYYADLRNVSVPPMLAERGGHLYSEAAIALIASLSGAAPGHHVIDVQNNGTLPFLSDASVIETSCYVERNSITHNPVFAAPNPVLKTLIESVKAYETLTVEAALTGERGTALRALACNPITADVDRTQPCLNEMLHQNRPLLTRFFQS